MQGDLFGREPRRAEPIVRPVATPVQHTPETIRTLMHDILAEARAAEALPWTARQLRSYTAMFPFMAEWLKGGEGDGLMAELKAELDRLQAPVEEMADNWRDLWAPLSEAPVPAARRR